MTQISGTKLEPTKLVPPRARVALSIRARDVKRWKSLATGLGQTGLLLTIQSNETANHHCAVSCLLRTTSAICFQTYFRGRL